MKQLSTPTRALFPCALACAFTVLACSPSTEAPRLDDSADLLTDSQEEVLAEQGELTRRETGVDFAWLLRSGFESGIDAHSPVFLEEAQIGPDGLALLIAYDRRTERARIEVGYGLEAIFPDTVAGRWIDGHMAPLFAANQPELALRLTNRMARDRVRRSLADGGLERAMLVHPSGGAGASGEARLDERPATRSAQPPGRAHAGDPAQPLSAASTVRGSYHLYRAWLEAGSFDTRAALFTEASRAFLAEWPMTPAYLEHILWTEEGRHFVAIERGDLALWVCIDDPHVAPHFFRRSADGRAWQMDLAAEVREVVNLIGGDFSWSFRSATSPALVPFAPDLVDFDGIVRLARGDNRRAVTTASRDAKP